MTKKVGKRNMRPFYMFFNTEGMDQRSGPMVALPTSAELVQNMHTDMLGAFSAYRQGFSRLTEQLESGAKMDGLCWFTDLAGTDYLVCAINGEVKNVNPVTGAVIGDIDTGLTGGNKPDFEAFQGNLYIAEKSITPIYWTGAGASAAVSLFPLTVSGETLDKPELLEKFNNRGVWGKFHDTATSANGYKSHLLITDSLDFETATLPGANDTDGTLVKVSPGDGQDLVGYRAFSIPTPDGVEEILVILKTRSLYVLTGDTPSTFRLRLFNSKIGAVNNRSIVEIDNDILWIGEDGIYSFTTATQANGLRPQATGSKDVKEILKTLNLEQTAKCWAQHIPERQEVWFAIPTGANTECDTIIVYHYPKDEKESASWIVRKNTTQTCSLLYKKTFLTGDNAGYINTWFNSSQYDETAINWIYRNHYYNFNSQAQDKQVLELFAWFLMYGSETMSFTTRWRGGGNNTEKSFSKTITLEDSANSIYGAIAPPAAVFGEAVYGSGAVLKKVKIPVYGNGEQLQLEVSGNTGNTGPIFLGFSGWVEYLGPARSYR